LGDKKSRRPKQHQDPHVQEARSSDRFGSYIRLDTVDPAGSSRSRLKKRSSGRILSDDNYLPSETDEEEPAQEDQPTVIRTESSRPVKIGPPRHTALVGSKNSRSARRAPALPVGVARASTGNARVGSDSQTITVLQSRWHNLNARVEGLEREKKATSIIIEALRKELRELSGEFSQYKSATSADLRHVPVAKEQRGGILNGELSALRSQVAVMSERIQQYDRLFMMIQRTQPPPSQQSTTLHPSAIPEVCARDATLIVQVDGTNVLPDARETHPQTTWSTVS
jgi:hypothetical protein